MKVYGMEICIDCRNFKHIKEARGLDWEYIDVLENTAILKEFLTIRDNRPEMEEVRAESGIGVPCFMLGDKITLDIDEAMSWMGQPAVQEFEIVEHRD